MPKHYLFVCSANCDRSPTAEALMKEMAVARHLDVEVKSAGVSVSDDRGPGVPLTLELCDWADAIYVMTPRHAETIIARYGQPATKVTSLDVEDCYRRGSDELKDVLRPKLTAILEADA